MTAQQAATPARRQLLRAAGGWLAAVGVSVLAILVLSLVYALIPEPDVHMTPIRVLLSGAFALFCYFALTIWAIMRLQRSRRPVQEGGILIAVLATIVILGYSWVYLGVLATDPESFNQPLTKTSAVYFTVTVLATVGFGDIVPVSDTARMIVTSQMLLGITLVTLGIRLIMQSARMAAQRRGTLALPGHSHDSRPPDPDEA